MFVPDREIPTEIDRSIVRLPYSCSEPEFVHFRQKAVRQWVTEITGAHEDGREILRSTALARLSDDDAAMVTRALTCIFVVRTSTDVVAVQPLTKHQDQD